MRFIINFAVHMVVVAQLVRASDCGSEGRGFETPQPPSKKDEKVSHVDTFFIILSLLFVI